MTILNDAYLHLTVNHVYEWGERLVKAGKVDGFWLLLCLDRDTGKPAPYGPDGIAGYELSNDNHWHAMYEQSDRPQNIVDVDVTQFKDLGALATWYPQNVLGRGKLKEGHIYAHGKLVFQANLETFDGQPAWMLTRINIYKGHLVKPIVAGSVTSYVQDSKGRWQVMKVGNPRTKRQRITEPSAAFERDILPNLRDVADSFEAYLDSQKGE